MIDQVDILVLSGNGGNGSVSGRREKFVPLGGPDGGDGGDGGSVILRCDGGINTLKEYNYRRKIVASSGGNGAGKLKHGRNGIDVISKVPIGTEIWVRGDTWKRTIDMVEHGQTVMVAQGGKGGRGNAKFTSSINRYPVLAEAGEIGDEAALRLKLKLLADVGIIGVPNVGKSSLLAAVSAAKPRIAAYPFTTIDPTLGVVEHRNKGFVMVDIPGLIEGANKGVGLGHQFLSHVERTKVLIHLLDGTSEECLEDYHKVRSELSLFNKELLLKPEIIAINKIDVPGAEEKCNYIESNIGGRGQEIMCISAAARQGLEGLLDSVLGALAGVNATKDLQGQAGGTVTHVLKPRQRERPVVSHTKDGTFVVSYRPAERLAEFVDGKSWEARLQLYEHMRRMGVVAALEKAGIASGDSFKVGKLDWDWD